MMKSFIYLNVTPVFLVSVLSRAAKLYSAVLGLEKNWDGDDLEIRMGFEEVT